MKSPGAPETLQETEEHAAAVMAPRAQLFLVLEADRPGAGGTRHSLEALDEVVIGRGDERLALRETDGRRRRLRVQVPGRWMSSTHVRLVRVQHGWVIEDCGSKNGTFVRGQRIQRQLLSDGELFDAGHTLFAYRAAVPTPAGSEPDVDSVRLADRPVGLRTLEPALARRYDAFTSVARSVVPILLLGETGTGKEVLARAAHEVSSRSGAFVAVNCGGLSPALVEGLLFGHVKGAFSGAARDEIGFVRAADRGTLFLDEIGDLPGAAQAALLRVLQEREVVPVGTTRPVGVDLRVICATHRPLDALVASQSFRHDLLMRIEGFRHGIAPLRDRREDIGVIVADLLPRLTGGRLAEVSFTTAAARALLEHRWPGNVRELGQTLARALALSKGTPIDVAHLELPPAPVLDATAATASDPDAEILRAKLVEQLAIHRGNVSEVARSMGKARMQIQRWMRRYGLDPESFRRSR